MKETGCKIYPSDAKYVLITPARNEAAFIELTLASVIAQTVRPLKWIIVNDGSTDETEAIVQKYCAQHEWIELIQMPPRKERDFAGKAHAFHAGYERLKSLQFAYIGSLDADISFEPDYFSFLLKQLEGNPRLGLAGTPFKEGTEMYDYRFVSIEHVSGACQLFRRKCFEEVGGYRPIEGGGIDHIAVLTARMKGWQTRTFPEKYSHHHRPQGSAKRSPLKIRIHVGKLDYALGGHPLWELCRVIYQMSKRPFIIGGLMIMVGYVSSMLQFKDRSITPELQSFRQREQLRRLKAFFINFVRV